MCTKQFAIIGCQHAHIGIFISEMLQLGYTCAGLYEDENDQLAGSLSRQYGIPLVQDKESLLADTVEVVGCASINDRKIDVIELCESRGKHVMLDKPAVTSREGLDRLKGVIDRGRIQIGMLLTERFHPAVYTLKRNIELGVLGEIVTIGMRKPHRLNAASRSAWFFSKHQSGGILVDLLVHDFDLLRWLTGKELVNVQGYVSKTIMPEHPTFYNTASVQVEIEDCIVAQLYADWHMPEQSWTWGDGRVYVTGTEGSAELRLQGDPLVGEEPSLLIQLTNREPAVRVPLVEPPYSISHDFVRRIEGLDCIVSHEDIVKTSEATIWADESAAYLQLDAKEPRR